jgi:hypothetical protein
MRKLAAIQEDVMEMTTVHIIYISLFWLVHLFVYRGRNPQVYEGLPYLCMVGDFSGKYGGLAYQNQTDGSASVVAQIKDPRMPSLQNLAGRGLLLKCGTESWCATLQRM